MGNKQAGNVKVEAEGSKMELEKIEYEPGSRPYPQETYIETTVDPDSFYGKLRTLYRDKVLKTQLDQLKKQGSYRVFDHKWQDVFNVRPLKGAMTRADGIPPSLFWESDVGKWIEAVSYFMASPSAEHSPHADDYKRGVQEIVDMMAKTQQADGYLDCYFSVVDKEGRFKNLRDMHEMYNAGHLLEGALAHYRWTGSRQYLDCLIKYVDLLMETFGPGGDQLHGYPGHPELELAILRLYNVTKDPRHLAFGTYLLQARGQKSDDMGGESYFLWEAKERRGGDETMPHTMDSLDDVWYHQAHAPLHDQTTILGHSVRAFYLTTAAADLGGPYLADAKRLWDDATRRKMYQTGGFGTEPRWEGFSSVPYRLPQSTDEGGCYQETCASIACMMTSERILSHGLDGEVRDVMELCMLNAVLGGGSLNGKQFSYANKLATYGEETAIRNDWFEVCCCPPNLSRTMGMLGGYTWAAKVDAPGKTIHLDVYLFVSAARSIKLPDGEVARVEMQSGMPWKGETQWTFKAPEGWGWKVRVPKPAYAGKVSLSQSGTEDAAGFLTVDLTATSTLSQTMELPVRLLASHPLTGTDTLSVSRGPIVYTAESVDNPALDSAYPHFVGLGLAQTETFDEVPMEIEGIGMVGLKTRGKAWVLEQAERGELYCPITAGEAGSAGAGAQRTWTQATEGIRFVPWFARANRGGAGRVRTAFPRVDKTASQ